LEAINSEMIGEAMSSAREAKNDAPTMSRVKIFIRDKAPFS
jgi:hypothetical protein